MGGIAIQDTAFLRCSKFNNVFALAVCGGCGHVRLLDTDLLPFVQHANMPPLTVDFVACSSRLKELTSRLGCWPDAPSEPYNPSHAWLAGEPVLPRSLSAHLLGEVGGATNLGTAVKAYAGESGASLKW